MRTLLLFIISMSTIFVSNANGATVLSHYGATDPKSENWEPEPGLGMITPVGPVFNDMGYDAWFVNDTVMSSSGSSDGYWGALTVEEKSVADSQGWRFRSRLRVANTPDTPLGSVSIYYFDGAKQWILDFGSNSLGEQIVTAVGHSDYYISSLGYHLYEMIYDQTSATASVFVDGVERISDWSGIGSSINPGKFKFGSRSSPDSGQGNYNLVEFSVVPIPSALLLLSSALVMLFIRRMWITLPFGFFVKSSR